LLAYLPRPWPETLARQFLAALQRPRPALTQALEWAALAIPLELLPQFGALPEPAEVDYGVRGFARALEQFAEVAALRRSIAAETAK
jgi:hypothetical protein